MTEVRVDAETPCLQVNLDTDPLRADHQLQQALRLNASRDELTPTSRKHSRSRSNSNYSVESDLITDVSGRFDDADEFDSCDEDGNHDTVAHSVKRRRSNDWPAQNDKGQADSGRPRYHESSFGRRWRLYHESNGRRPNQNNSSPRTTTSYKNGSLPRPRRSRFVEGSMNDSVSEKPPSIFLRDDWHLEGEKGANNTGASHKSSGIFRFGKAIASAFNPFGGWGNVSDVWKGGSAEENQQQQQQQQQPEDDDIVQVQKAYEELKKAGFKGTVKGAYTQGAQADSSNLPEQTWKAIQEKMDYKQPSVSGRHSRQISGESQDTAGSASIRTSLQELRKAKSSLGISVKNTPGRGSEDSECLDLRKQKSRKDMLRQAKLLKKVSNLEDKLTRARRELRELSGPEEEQPVPPRTMSLEAIAQEDKPYYPRKFVPGALPTLPSERCLEDQAAAEDNELSALPTFPAPPSNTPQDNKHATPKSKAKSPKSPKEARQSSASLTTDSPSLKRKSPDPESLGSAQVTEPNKQDNDEDQPMTNSDPLTTITNTTPGNRLRKAKFQKMGKGDSPGSVERKQSQERPEADDSNNNQNLLTPGTTSGREGKGRRKPRYLNPTSPKSSPSARRSASVSTPRGESCGPSLRMKKGRNDLRSASVDTDADVVGDRMDCDDDDDDSSPSNNTRQRTFYMQGEHHLDPDKDATSPSPSKGRERRARHEYIPPVPPLPKDLAATAAKVDRRLAKELGRRKGGLRQTRERKKEDFEWPEDIF